MAEVRVGLVGVGNCCSALVQAVTLYGGPKGASLEGIMHPELGGYKVSDVRFVAAFDIDSRKVGRDLSQAIFSPPNDAPLISEVPALGVKVVKGPVLDGVGPFSKDVLEVDASPPAQVAEELRRSRADVVVNMTPSGAVKATEFYAGEAVRAGCGFVNATPNRIASRKAWAKRFKEAKLPLVGDDLMDQVGSTILHRAIFETLNRRGVHVDRSYALDVGGGAENLNALDRDRNVLKRRIKAASIMSSLPYPVPVTAGTTDYVEFLRNERTSYLWIEGHFLAGTPVVIDAKFTTADAPNGVNLLLDAIRGVKIGLDRGLSGPLNEVSAYGFKSPPKPMAEAEALARFNAFVKRR
ncbi:MAG: inositol-3-phosphate synthase [Candidatus Bathyarchaeia archaeon]